MRRALDRGKQKRETGEYCAGGVWETNGEGCRANAIFPIVWFMGSLYPQTFYGRPDVVCLLHTTATHSSVCTLRWMRRLVFSTNQAWRLVGLLTATLAVQPMPVWLQNVLYEAATTVLFWFCVHPWDDVFLYSVRPNGEDPWRSSATSRRYSLSQECGVHVQLLASPADGLHLHGTSWLRRTDISRQMLLA